MTLLPFEGDAATLLPAEKYGTLWINNDKAFGLVQIRLGSVHGSTLQDRSIASLLMVGVFSLGIGAMGHVYAPKVTETANTIVEAAALDEIVDSDPLQAMVDTAVKVQKFAKAAIKPKPELTTRIVELGKGRTFARMLMDAAIPKDQAMAASSALGKVYDHRSLRAGQEVTLSVTTLKDEYTLTALTFEPASTKELSIVRLYDGSYSAELKNTPVERRRIAVKSKIKNSLYLAGAKQGVPRGIMASLIRAYSHQIDFQRDIHTGDSFEILYDQPTARNGNAVGQGVIIYAALHTGGRTFPIYRVTFGDGAVDYFNEKGQSVKRSLLRTPLSNARITSSFGRRRHPLLGYTRMHKGVDFGARRGTPIFAAGNGTVIKAKWNGGYGKFIKIRHNGRTYTAYAHMKKFAKGLRKGTRVKQGDVIGFVGNTGRSTGPHLHYEVIIDGRARNPMKVSMPTGRILKGKTLRQFRKGQGKLKEEFMALLKQRSDNKKTASTKASKIDSIKVAAKR